MITRSDKRIQSYLGTLGDIRRALRKCGLAVSPSNEEHAIRWVRACAQAGADAALEELDAAATGQLADDAWPEVQDWRESVGLKRGEEKEAEPKAFRARY